MIKDIINNLSHHIAFLRAMESDSDSRKSALGTTFWDDIKD